MIDFTKRLTELDAVNIIISTGGSTPVSSLDNQLSATTVLCRSILREIGQRVMAKGYAFNTEYDVTFTPDNTGKIFLDESIAEILLSPSSYPNTDIVERGQYLYDRKNHSYVFNGEIKAAKVVYYLDWENLPNIFRHYIALRAARTYAQRHIGDSATFNFSSIDENEARSSVEQYEARTGHHSIFNSSRTYNTIRRP